MTRWAGLAVASLCILGAVWGCVLLAHLMRPVILVPNDRGVPVWPVCRMDTAGIAPKLVYLPITIE